MRCQAVEGQVTLRPMADNVAARPRATLLLTRPRAASERFSPPRSSACLPLDIVIAPLMEIVATDPPPLPVVQSLIFTSPMPFLAGPGPVAAPGAWVRAPRRPATHAGFDGVVAGPPPMTWWRCLNEERPGPRLVHLRGRHQRGDVADRLAAAGLSVTSHVVYDQVAARPTRPSPRRCQSAASRPLFSPEARNCSRRRQGHRGSRVRIDHPRAQPGGSRPFSD
jgi:uroporphyrinogen-III synthase